MIQIVSRLHSRTSQLWSIHEWSLSAPSYGRLLSVPSISLRGRREGHLFGVATDWKSVVQRDLTSASKSSAPAPKTEHAVRPIAHRVKGQTRESTP